MIAKALIAKVMIAKSWRGPAESNRYHRSGTPGHNHYTRSALTWWVTAESTRACAKAQVLQTRSVTRLGVTREVGCRPWGCTRLNAAYETAWIPNRSACDRNGTEALASAAPAYVRPGAKWRRAEESNLHPEGATVFKTAGRPSRLDSPIWLPLREQNARPPPSDDGAHLQLS